MGVWAGVGWAGRRPDPKPEPGVGMLLARGAVCSAGSACEVSKCQQDEMGHSRTGIHYQQPEARLQAQSLQAQSLGVAAKVVIVATALQQ